MKDIKTFYTIYYFLISKWVSYKSVSSLKEARQFVKDRKINNSLYTWMIIKYSPKKVV